MERNAVLKEVSLAIGTAWARSVCDNIKEQGRVIAGGWPGTLAEARARIATRLRDELVLHGMKALDPEELEQAVSATYVRAKQEWLGIERRVDSQPVSK